MTEQMIKDAVRAAIAEERAEFWVNAEQHYLDHQALLKCRAGEEPRRRRTEFINDLMKLGEERVKESVRLGIAIQERQAEAIKIGWRMLVTGSLRLVVYGALGYAAVTIFKGVKP